MSRPVSCLVAAAVAFAAILVIPPLPGRAGSSSPLVRELTPLPAPVNNEARLPSIVQLDPPARRGFVITGLGDNTISVTGFNLDTFAQQGSREIGEFPASPSKPSYGYLADAAAGRLIVMDAAQWVHVFDQDTLAELAMLPGPLPFDFASELLRPGGSRRAALRGQIRRTPVPGQAISMKLLPPGPGNANWKIIIVSHDQSAGVVVHRWDLATGEQDWVQQVSPCSSGVPDNAFIPRRSAGIAVLDTPQGRELVIGCVNRSSVGELWRFPISAVDGTLGPAVPVTTVFNGGDFLIAGRRAFSITSGPQQAIVGIDMDRAGAIGQVGLSFRFEDSVGAGIDPGTGRVYGLSRPSRDDVFGTGKSTAGGLFITDGARSPLPQGDAVVELASAAADMIAVDPATPGRPARLFVRRCFPEGVAKDCRQSREHFVRVFEDLVPQGKDVPLSDNDRFTVNVPERDGETISQFTGAGSGYGVRAILLGGIEAVPDPVGYFLGSSLTKDTAYEHFALGCGRTNREFIFARVLPSTALANTGATAAASPAEADPRSLQDMDKPLDACFSDIGRFPRNIGYNNGPRPWREPRPGSEQGVDDELGPRFPFRPAVCLPPDRRSDDTEMGRIYPQAPELDGWRARVHCPEGDKSVVAWATAGRNGIGGEDVDEFDLGFEGASVRTEVERRSGGGVKVTTTSEVTGLNVGGSLRIGKITSVATSEAAGRVDTAVATVRAQICGIEVPGDPNAGKEACQETRSTQFQAYLQGLNQALMRRNIELRVPRPDADLLRGTPGGALAGVQKDRFTSVGDQVENNDFSSALPALEIVKTHASQKGLGRQIFQFAAVQGSTSYNISLVPTGVGGGEDPSEELAGGVDELVEPIGGGAPSILAVASTETNKPSIATRIAEGLRALIRTVKMILRNPLTALPLVAIIFTAFAVPLHLLDRRRALLAVFSENA